MTYAATAQSSTVTAEYNGWCNRETWVVTSRGIEPRLQG